MKNTFTAKHVSINALTVAFVCLSTMFLQFPIPLGYAHLGNTFILITSIFFGPVTGLLAGSIGSAMADLLTGYPQWIIPTLLIKGLMGWIVGFISNRSHKTFYIFKIRTALACITGTIIMVIGYFIAGSILYGSFYTGAAQIPGLIAEGMVGIILFYFLGSALYAAHLPKYIQQFYDK